MKQFRKSSGERTDYSYRKGAGLYPAPGLTGKEKDLTSIGAAADDGRGKIGVARNHGRIVISGMWPTNRQKPRFPRNYAVSIEKAGGTPMVMSSHPLAPGETPPDHVETISDVDPEDVRLPDDAVGLVLTGGGDVDPHLYGAEPHARSYNVSRRRDEFELELLGQALDRDMPVLAICRGMQLLNVRLGGTLDQNITDTPGRLDHDRDRVRAEAAHDVEIEPGTVLAGIFGTSAHVNSHHHQGLDVVARGLDEIAWAPDGVLEAVVMPDRSWAVGVQWHPEVMAAVDKQELGLFREFVEATRKYAARSAVKVRTA